MHFKLPGLLVDANKCHLNLNCNFMYAQQDNINISFCNNSIDFYFCRIYLSMFEKYIDVLYFFEVVFLYIIYTNSRKHVIGFTPGVFQGVYFEVFISFVHCFVIIIKEKCSPFKQGIIQQHIMSINNVKTLMKELSDPSS